MNDLLRRDAALRKTLAKYGGKPFDWAGDHCIAMLRSHLVAMGHKGLPKLPKFHDAAGAKRALKAMGHESVAGLLDAHLPRIRPAEALPGDVLTLKGQAGLDGVIISLGEKAAGWNERSPVFERRIIPLQIEGAWRA